MDENVQARAARYGWTTHPSDADGGIWLTSPCGDVYDCQTEGDAHDVLTVALLSAWSRHERCRQIVTLANDPSHGAHEAVLGWLNDPLSTFDPWEGLPDFRMAWETLPDRLPEGFEALCVDGYQGSNLRLAMERFKAIEGAHQLAEALTSAPFVRWRQRL